MTMLIFINMSFGTELKKVRKAKGLTQAEFAEKIGVTQTAVAHYERGAKKPEMDKIPLIAQALGIKIEELYGVSSKKSDIKTQPHKNKRSEKVRTLFEKLKPDEQRLVLKQIQLMAKAS